VAIGVKWAEVQSIIGGKRVSNVPDWVLQQAKSRDFQPTVRIGKSGLSGMVEKELQDQLMTKKIVKVKVNKGLFDKSQLKDVWAHLAGASDSVVVLSRGNVCVFYKK
jgi:RNA-binding protein YhbY